MGMTNYQPLRSYAVTRYAFYKLRTFPLRAMRALRQILRKYLALRALRFTLETALKL